MAIIKLISDFDGVWTNQETEAVYVWSYIVSRLSLLSGFPTKEINELWIKCREDMDERPYDYGWRSGGHIACYYQEDPFGDNNAIFDYIEKNASRSSYLNYKQKLAAIKDAVLKWTKNKSLADFSNECFVKSTSQFKLEGKLKPVTEAGKVIKELNRKGIEIVVASNSKTEKIEHLFRKAGYKMTNEKSIARGRLHARGDAQKFVIENSFTEIPEKLEINKRYKPELRRKHYFKILLEEKPDFVIGDVFSLDLALPVYLRLNDERFNKLKIIQKVHSHTPKWVKDYMGSEELKGIGFMVNSIDELPSLLSNEN